MEKPKIIVFTTSYHPFMGGAEVAIQEITRRLKERFDFYIVTSRFRRDLPAREVRLEGTIVRLGFGTRLDKYLLILAPFYYRGRISIVLGVDIGQGSLVAAIYKFFHPKTYFILNIQYGEGEKRLSSGRFGAISAAFRFMLGQADHVTAISSYLLDLARKYGYKGPGEVIHNGVDIRKFEIRNPKSETNSKSRNSKTIITTSRLVPKNGVDILIKAIAEVKKTIPTVQLHIVGDGTERNNYQSLVTNHQLEGNVKLFGHVPYEEIPKYLHEADIFVRPSRSEGMGNSFVEALAAGLPVIGTPVGGITDIIEDGRTGVLARPEDPQDLAEKIILLLNNQNLSASIVEEGRKTVEERFSWDKIAERYADRFNYRGAASIGEAEPLRITIATPLMPPQIGGPAQYAQNLAKEFISFGHSVKVVSFGRYLRFPSGVRHLFYLVELARQALNCDLIFALDYTSVGIPAAMAYLVFKKSLVIRVEGDFLWESFVERTRQDITLTGFYQNPPLLNRKEILVKWLSGWVMRRAKKLVFSSEWRRKMVVDAYKISPEKTEIVRNVFPSSSSNQLPVTSNRVILWAGRVLYLKNLRRLIKAFASTNVSSYELHLIGEGPERGRLEGLVKERGIRNVFFFDPIPRSELLEKISKSAFLVLPSLSDVGPNVVAEAVGAGVRVIMTKESGYAEDFRGRVELVDPLDEDDLRKKLEKFMENPDERIPQSFKPRSWTAASKDWIKLFSEL